MSSASVDKVEEILADLAWLIDAAATQRKSTAQLKGKSLLIKDLYANEISEAATALKQELKQSLEARVGEDEEAQYDYGEATWGDSIAEHASVVYGRNEAKAEFREAISQVFQDKGDNRECPACAQGVSAYKTKVGEVNLLCKKHSDELNATLGEIIEKEGV